MMRFTRSVRSSALLALACCLAQQAPAAQVNVLSEQKISDTAGGFGGVLRNGDEFGYATASLGDLDGDGVIDLAVGARNDNDGGLDRGAVWILFLNADGTVKGQQKISDLAGGFTGVLDDNDVFGSAVDGLGDVDGDGIVDLAVGARFDDDGGLNRGAVWILFLNADGTVKAHQKISNTEGGFLGLLDDVDQFGTAVAKLGDLDGDAVGDLAVGANLDDDGGVNRGAVWVLFLNADGTVKAHQKISDTAGGFLGVLDAGDQLGFSVVSLGDLDGDAVADLAVGAIGDDDGGLNRGAAWILFLNADGTVKAHRKISDTAGGFLGTLDDSDTFGQTVACLGDIDGDGNEDIVVGAVGDDDGGPERGAVWILLLDADGTVASEHKISDVAGGLDGVLDDLDNFGISAAALGDLDGNGIEDLAVGAHRDDDGGSSRGALWILHLTDTDATPPVVTCPDDVVQEGTGPGGAVVTFGASATDDIDPSPIVACVPASGDTFPFGTTTVTCTATDSSGNFSTCSFDVTVVDTTPPVASCPDDLTVEGTSPSGALASFSPSASDACDPAPSVVSEPASGSTFPLGTTSVLVTATDASGNSSTCSFDVTVVDTTPPVATCPGNLSVEATSPAGGIASFSPTASDACDPAPAIVSEPASGNIFPFGTTSVTVTATDASGNSSTCGFDVTVADTTPPVVTCPDTIRVRVPKNNQGPLPVTYSASASDACDPAPSVVFVPPSGSLFSWGTTTVTCTATDVSGNSSSCSFQVVVGPTLLPASPPGLFVVHAPLQAAPGGPRAARRDAAQPAADLVFSYPAGEPLLVLEVTDARVELSDGAARVELYSPAPPEPGEIAEIETMVVFADLSVLFPYSTAETVFTLVSDALGAAARVGEPSFQGGLSVRNGSDVNETILVSPVRPRAGHEWQAWVDVSAHPRAKATLLVVTAQPHPGMASPQGEILVDVFSRRPLAWTIVPSSGGTDVHVMRIPATVALVSFSVQASILGIEGLALTNALDAVVGD